MTTPMSDETRVYLQNCYDDGDWGEIGERWPAVLARIEALIAERDAAVSEAAWNHTQAVANKAERDAAVASIAVFTQGNVQTALDACAVLAAAEGERRATAAIVVWHEQQQAWHNKHDDGLSGFDYMALAHEESAQAIRDGDHITEAKPPQD
jgi:uncharacterized cupredoxin-like copper-binding protein